jgi:hypothetical protein
MTKAPPRTRSCKAAIPETLGEVIAKVKKTRIASQTYGGPLDSELAHLRYRANLPLPRVLAPGARRATIPVVRPPLSLAFALNLVFALNMAPLQTIASAFRRPG